MNDKNDKNKKAFKITIKKMAPVVLVAIIATALGLFSLLRSKVPMIKNFGIMLTIGLVVAFLVVVFIFMPILYIKDKHFPTEKKKNKKDKEIKNSNKFVNKVLDFIFKFKYVIIVIAFGLAITGIIVDQNIEAETNIENFMPQDSEALADIRELRSTLGSIEQIAIVVTSENIFDQDTLEALVTINEDILPNYSDVVIEYESLISMFKMIGINELEFINDQTIENIPKDQRKLFINSNYTVTVLNVSITDLDEEDFKNFVDELDLELNNLSDAINITITGQSVIDSEMMRALTTGRYEITIIGLVLIFVTLLIIYRSFYRAILPIIPIILIIGWSGGIMAIFNLQYTPLTATLGALIMGIGTSYTILITDRFKEESEHYDNRLDAIKSAVYKMGKPILISALTTIGGFSALMFSDFVILSNFGIMTVISFGLALLSSFIILPSILAISFKGKDVKNIETS